MRNGHLQTFFSEIVIKIQSFPLENAVENVWKMATINVLSLIHGYCEISNIRHTLVGNKSINHSDVVGALPVSDAPTTSSFLTSHLASMDWAKTTARQDEKHLSFGFCATYIRGLPIISSLLPVSSPHACCLSNIELPTQACLTNVPIKHPQGDNFFLAAQILHFYGINKWVRSIF